MTVARPTAVLLVAVLVAAGAGGCSSAGDSAPATTAQWVTAAGHDVNCPGHAEPRVRRSPLRYDIDNDGIDETIVDFVCAGDGIDAARAADQVEVFRGSGRDDRLAQLSRIIVDGPAADLFLAQGCIYVTANKVVLVGHVRPARAGFAVAPSVLVAQVSAWDGHHLTAGKFTPLSNAAALPPGCA